MFPSTQPWKFIAEVKQSIQYPDKAYQLTLKSCHAVLYKVFFLTIENSEVFCGALLTALCNFYVLALCVRV